MASLFGHGLVGWTLAQSGRKYIKHILFWAIFSAILPDFDVISFRFGIPYESIFGHRGFTHSILFAVIWAYIISLFYREYQWRTFNIVFFATCSHGVLDAMTTGGLGVAFFAPFLPDRYFFPFRFIQVSPIGVSKFFSHWGWMVIKSELIWIGIPVLIYQFIRRLFNPTH